MAWKVATLESVVSGCPSNGLTRLREAGGKLFSVPGVAGNLKVKVTTFRALDSTTVFQVSTLPF